MGLLERIKILREYAHHCISHDEISWEFDDWADGRKRFSYDVIATKYFLAPEILSTELISKIGETPRLNIIDFACGSGLSGLPFILAGHNVDGIDISPSMLNIAKNNGYMNIWDADLVISNTKFLRGYDLALCVGCMGDYVSPQIILPKMNKSLNDKAIIGFTVLDDKKINSKDISKLLNKFGFSDIQYFHRLSVNPAEFKQGREIKEQHYHYFIAERK